MKAKAKLFIFVIFASCLLAAVGMRVVTYTLAYDPDNFVTGLFVGQAAMMDSILTSPFDIAIENSTVQMVGLACFLVPLFIVFYGSMQGLKGNYKSGTEHGEERFANEREAAALLDKKVYSNNLFFTKHCGILVQPHTKQAKETVRSLNLNCLTVGISGLGKTFNLSWHEMLQSVGDALKGYYCSWLRAFEHVSPKLKARTREAANRIGRRTAKTLGPISSIMARARRAMKAKKWINEGFDVFNTDPKGMNLKDVGHLYKAAGYKIKAFNTVDFEQSSRYNPLAYIKTRLTNIKNPDALECAIRATLGDESFTTDEGNAITPDAVYRRSGDRYVVSANLDVSTERFSYSNEEDIDDEIQRDLDDIANRAGEKILEVAKSFSYFKSTATMTVAYQNTGWQDESPEIAVALDPALVVENISYVGDISYDEEKSHILWEPGVIAGRPKGTKDADVEPVALTISCKMKLTRIPDGVDLTKTVNCLAENLNEKKPESQAEDPFWESTKRLAFMADISLLFEKYDREYRNIPEMMRLLNMAKVSSDGNTLSPLDVLMEAWETGYLYMPKKGCAQRGMRDRLATGGDWVKAENDPHDPQYSMALHCYHAYNSGAAETVQSVIVSCHAALTKMFSEEIQNLTRVDEMELDTLGDPNQKQIIFNIVDDLDPTYHFLSALLIYQSMTLPCAKAYKKYGGKLPRHVRFILDEFPNIGKIPHFATLISVIRSRNMSVHMFAQSFSQMIKTYGKEDAETIQDCCSVLNFLGAQTTENLKVIKEMLGEETVYAETYSRAFNNCGFEQSTNQNVQSHAKSLKTTAQLRRQDKDKMLCFVFGQRPVEDEKNATWEHPLFCYIDPESDRSLKQPIARFSKRFDYVEYLEEERRKAAV